MKLSIILPAYNEEETIAATLEDFAAYFPKAEYIVVSNASTDQTLQIAEATLRKLKLPGKVVEETRKGKSLAFRRGFLESSGDYILLADADKTYPAKDAAALLQPVFDGKADMTVGNRNHQDLYQKENKRPLHFFGNRIIRWLVNFLFKASLKDVMSGYRAFHRDFLLLYPNLQKGFELETDLTLFALHNRFRIEELPIHYSDRPIGSFSKLRTFKDGAKVLYCIAQVLRYYRPLLFFLSISFVFAVSGLLLSIPVWQDWFLYRYIYHIPLAILASSLELFALITASIGFILDSIARQGKIDFEFRYIKTIKDRALRS